MWKATQRQQDTEDIKSKTRFQRLDQRLQHGHTLNSVVLHWDRNLGRGCVGNGSREVICLLLLLQPPHDHHHIYYDTDYGAVLIEDISQCTCLLMEPPWESFTKDKQDKQTNKTLITFISSGSPVPQFFHEQHCRFSFLYYTAKTSQNCLVAIEGRKSLGHSGGESWAADPSRKKVILVVMRWRTSKRLFETHPDRIRLESMAACPAKHKGHIFFYFNFLSQATE